MTAKKKSRARARRRGILFVISAPSGAGKTTLAAKLLARNENLVRSISATTRPSRSGEKEGVDYFFLERKEFMERRRKGEFLEWAKVFLHYYGTPRTFLESEIHQGHDVLACIDVQGARKIQRNWPGAVLIFVLPPSLKSLEARLKKRKTESGKEIRQRIKIAQWEMSQERWYDYRVVNDRIEDALKQLQSIIQKEHKKVNT